MAGIKTATEIISKTPDEVIIRDIDFDNDDLATGETLSTIDSAVVSPSETGGLSVDSKTVSARLAQLTLSAGIADTLYTILVTVTTNENQELQARVKVRVEEA